MSYLSPLLIYNVITFWGWGGLLAKQGVCMHFERMMWYMYSRSLSALAPQWATSWQHRGRWPTGSTRHTWFGSLWIVWSLGSTYSSTSRPLSRSSRPAACREQGRKGGRERGTTTTTTTTLLSLLSSFSYRRYVFCGGAGKTRRQCSYLSQQFHWIKVNW